MSRTKYATVAERDGELNLFRGKKKTNFSLIRMVEGDGDKMMERMEFNRKALLHLPEPMTKDEFKEFTEGRNIRDVINDCFGLENHRLEGAEPAQPPADAPRDGNGDAVLDGGDE